MPGFSDDYPIVRVYDPSLEGMSANVTNAYAAMNEQIAKENNLYGASVQRYHLSNSHDAIMSTATAGLMRSSIGASRKALILGAGNCFDIPVSGIVDSFDHTVLVDVHTEGTERALSNLTSRQLAKVSLVGADVTGKMSGLTSVIDEVGRNSRNYSDFIESATAAIRNFESSSGKPDMGNNYAFVCSQLLLTQLCTIPFDYMRDKIVEDKFQQQLSPALGGPDEPLLRAINEAIIGTQTDHIAHLASLVGKTGNVHFADTYAELEVTPRGVKQLPIIFDNLLKPTVDAHFKEIAPRTSWIWQSTVNREFLVVSNSLAPRAHS